MLMARKKVMKKQRRSKNRVDGKCYPLQLGNRVGVGIFGWQDLNVCWGDKINESG
jgi:hypothetical protein